MYSMSCFVQLSNLCCAAHVLQECMGTCNRPGEVGGAPKVVCKQSAGVVSDPLDTCGITEPEWVPAGYCISKCRCQSFGQLTAGRAQLRAGRMCMSYLGKETCHVCVQQRVTVQSLQPMIGSELGDSLGLILYAQRCLATTTTYTAAVATAAAAAAAAHLPVDSCRVGSLIDSAVLPDIPSTVEGQIWRRGQLQAQACIGCASPDQEVAVYKLDTDISGYNRSVTFSLCDPALEPNTVVAVYPIIKGVEGKLGALHPTDGGG